MSDKAKRLLKQALQAYRDEDDSSRLGSYRDAITDLLHLINKDKMVSKECPGYSVRDIADEGYGAFMEELEQAEYDKMVKIPDKDLPLHINDKWEFDSVIQEFWNRVKGVDPCLSKDTSTENSSAS